MTHRIHMVLCPEGCGVVFGDPADQGKATIRPHKTYEEGGGPGPDLSHKMVICSAVGRVVRIEDAP